MSIFDKDEKRYVYSLHKKKGCCTKYTFGKVGVVTDMAKGVPVTDVL